MSTEMTSRDRVLTAFAHQEPDRVPVWLGASPEFKEKARLHLGLADDESLHRLVGDDFRRVYARYAGPPDADPSKNLSPGAVSRTPFGIERHGYFYGQPMSHPLARATLEQVHAYPWPDPTWMDVSEVRSDALKWKGEYAILGGDWSPFFHDAIDMFGMETLIYTMYDAPELVDAVLQHLVDYYAAVSRRIFEAAADAIDIFFIGNDFGTQTGPAIGEPLFRRFMLPHLRRLVELGHDYGLKVLMHCCGGFAPLIPALIEIGLDGLQALQPACRGMEPAGLKRAFGDRMVFEGCIDSQRVLIEGTPDLVRSRVRQVLEVMKPGGGYVCSPSHDFVLPETPVENVLALYETVRDYGGY